MLIKKSEEKDIKDIMIIINEAKLYMKESGIGQWQDGYPNENSIKGDIEKGHSYIIINESEVVGTFALSFDGDKNYNIIDGGKWLQNNLYGVIHRIAMKNKVKGKGSAGEIIRFAVEKSLEKEINSLRMDTHEENNSMRKFLEKNDFKYCGIIYLEDGNPRVAYEKIFR